MDLQEARELARKKMKGCYVCPECDGKACKGMIPGFGGLRTAKSFLRNVEAWPNMVWSCAAWTVNWIPIRRSRFSAKKSACRSSSLLSVASSSIPRSPAIRLR